MLTSPSREQNLQRKSIFQPECRMEKPCHAEYRKHSTQKRLAFEDIAIGSIQWRTGKGQQPQKWTLRQ